MTMILIDALMVTISAVVGIGTGYWLRRRPVSETISDEEQWIADRNAEEKAESSEQLMGFEGAGAAQYFSVFGSCLSSDTFAFSKRTRRPPKDPINAMLGFGYQILWNHLLVLIDLHGMDPYCACLHEASPKHAALASDLIEEFRAPIVDSLVLYLVNSGIVDADTDFDWVDDGCYLNSPGRRKFLQILIQRMSELLRIGSDACPRWHYLTQQVKEYARCLTEPKSPYQLYLIR